MKLENEYLEAIIVIDSCRNHPKPDYRTMGESLSSNKGCKQSCHNVPTNYKGQMAVLLKKHSRNNLN